MANKTVTAEEREKVQCPACKARWGDCAGHMQLRDSCYDDGVLRANDARIHQGDDGRRARSRA